MTDQNRPKYPIDFVGSIPLESAETVFRALAASVGERASRWLDGETGERASRWLDGETGERAYWIRWQK